MVIKQVDRFPFREFMVVIAFTGLHYIAIGRDKQNREVAKVTSGDIDDIKYDIKSALLKLSATFVDYPSAIRLFLRAYPKGFTDPFYYHDERNYKLKAHDKAIELLGKERLATLIAAGKYSHIGDAAKKTFINLTFPNEVMKFSDFLKHGKEARDFSNHLYELLYGDSFDHAFDRMAMLLKPFEAAKWTILTYWPFIVHPDKQMFLKPEASQNCARHLGWDFGYDSYPTAATYRRYLKFVDALRSGIASLNPRDNIDVQTFMYAVGNPGFVREAVEARLKWEAQNRQT